MASYREVGVSSMREMLILDLVFPRSERIFLRVRTTGFHGLLSITAKDCRYPMSTDSSLSLLLTNSSSELGSNLTPVQVSVNVRITNQDRRHRISTICCSDGKKSVEPGSADT